MEGKKETECAGHRELIACRTTVGQRSSVSGRLCLLVKTVTRGRAQGPPVVDALERFPELLVSSQDFPNSLLTLALKEMHQKWLLASGMGQEEHPKKRVEMVEGKKEGLLLSSQRAV
ncbi:hypothetical protein RRG08_044288 [Elysia crispata]|uniref:Uncharacterized protein n=1 Tax=Elysia crispata TaxID=231223 RepID=A0AAE1CP41_9GAST|nr:hypothetical protein RRG08_044288 [Elysia crispata]